MGMQYSLIALLALLLPLSGYSMGAAVTSPTNASCVNTIYVDPQSQAAGNGSLQSPFRSWESVTTFAAGNCYLQKAGSTYAKLLIVRAKGTKEQPIVFGTYGGSQRAYFRESIVIEQSEFLVVENFRVTGATYSGFILRDKTNNVTLKNNFVSDSPVGIYFASDVGGKNLVAKNELRNNAYFGIGVEQVNNTADTMSELVENIVAGNGSHGIELTGSYFVVRGNRVYSNGGKFSGSSGIHVYAGGADGSARLDTGAFNQIYGNIAFSNLDNGPSGTSPGQDGNGIQLDQFTHDNLVSNNSMYFNDGPGLSLFDSFSNRIVNNTMLGNVRNTNGVHFNKGEVFLGTAGASVNLTKDNLFNGNTAMALKVENFAAYVDELTAKNPNTYGKNKLSNINKSGFAIYFGGVVQ